MLKQYELERIIPANGGKLLIYKLDDFAEEGCQWKSCIEDATHASVMVAEKSEDDAITTTCDEHTDSTIKLCTSTPYHVTRLVQ